MDQTEKENKIKEIEDYISQGMKISDACLKAGIARSLYYDFKYRERKKLRKQNLEKPPIKNRVTLLNIPMNEAPKDKQVKILIGDASEIKSILEKLGL